MVVESQGVGVPAPIKFRQQLVVPFQRLRFPLCPVTNCKLPLLTASLRPLPSNATAQRPSLGSPSVAQFAVVLLGGSEADDLDARALLSSGSAGSFGIHSAAWSPSASSVGKPGVLHVGHVKGARRRGPGLPSLPPRRRRAAACSRLYACLLALAVRFLATGLEPEVRWTALRLGVASTMPCKLYEATTIITAESIFFVF